MVLAPSLYAIKFNLKTWESPHYFTPPEPLLELSTTKWNRHSRLDIPHLIQEVFIPWAVKYYRRQDEVKMAYLLSYNILMCHMSNKVIAFIQQKTNGIK